MQQKKGIVGLCIQLVNGNGPFRALYNVVESEHTVELVLKPSCCGKDTSLSHVAGVHFTVEDIATFRSNNKVMKGHALWDMGLNVLQLMKKALSLVPKLSPRIVLIDKNCAVTGYASGKNKASFLQYINNGMFALTKTDAGNMLVLDESDDDDEVLCAKTKEGMSVTREDVLIPCVGTTTTDESITGPTDFEDIVVDDPIGLDSWNPFKGIVAPEGYSYLGKLPFICFGPSSKLFASTLAMEGQAAHTLDEKKEGSRKVQRKITKERANNDREVGIDRGMRMQAGMQYAFMAQNEDDANQRHRDMRMVILTKQIESTERLVELKLKISERMGVVLFAAINTLMDKLERLNADLEIMLGEVRSTNSIVGNVLENAAKSMGLAVTMDVMSNRSVGGGSIRSLAVGEVVIPNDNNEKGLDRYEDRVDDLLNNE